MKNEIIVGMLINICEYSSHKYIFLMSDEIP